WVDVDRDGDLDVSFGNRGSFGVANTIYRNQGGTFVAHWTSTETDETVDVAWGDLDGDGWADQVVANRNGLDRVYRNVNGTPQLVGSIDSQGATWALALADDDADGDLDIWLARRNEPDRLLLNDGSSLTLGWQATEVTDSTGIVVGDFDLDGELDHATVSYNGGMRVYLGGEGRSCDPRTAFSPLAPDIYVRGMAWGDADGDGDVDLAVAGDVEDAVFETVSGQFLRAAPIWRSGGYDPSLRARFSDIDLDGDQDLILVGESDTYGIRPTRVYANDGTGQFTSTQTLTTEWTEDIAVFDWDGDGDDDLLLANNSRCSLYTCSSGRERLYRNDAGTFVSAQRLNPDDRSKEIAAADIDGDGDIDLALGNETADRVYLSSGVGGTYSLFWTSPLSRQTDDVAWGDADGDGDLDLAIAMGGVEPRVYENTGTNLVQSWIGPAGHDAKNVAFGDWDGDGDMELAVAGSRDGLVEPITIVELGAGGAWNVVWTSSFLSDPSEIAFVDTNGDGIEELSVAEEWDRVFVIDPGDADNDGTPNACEPVLVQNAFPVAGGVAEVVAINAMVGSDVEFQASLQRGSTPVAGCPGLSVDLLQPQVLGSTTVGGSGVARVNATVPVGAGGHTAWVQAVDLTRCIKGDRVRMEVAP
ncbi:MAG: VCBS repeat-containing protein, partial [Myxococcales bacterium]|nr:VCBS repeat-containing protein [Myxococcales bacterium]